MIKLALKVEALNKYGGFTTNRIKEGFTKNSTSRGPSSTLKPQVKGEVRKPQQEPTSKSRQCFKCHEFGHIASECPNRRVVALVEEYEVEEEDVEDVCHLLLGRPWQYDRKAIYDGFKNTYTFRKDGHKIVLASLKPAITPTSKLAEKNSFLSKSELEKEIRAGSDVMALVAIEETESEKEILKEVEPILA